MTRQKKFKKRVRARMAETGERFTEAQAAVEGGGPGGKDDVEARLLEARLRGNVQEVLGIVRVFHDGGRPWSVLAAEVLEVLWPDREAVTAPEVATGLREFLRSWGGGGLPEGSAVLPCVLSSPGEGLREPAGVAEPGDDAWYAGDGPGHPEGAEEMLGNLWRYAPDVSGAFGAPSSDGTPPVYVSPDLVRGVARELRRGDAVHGGLADDLVRYADEILRLRGKLVDAGIDPDEILRLRGKLVDAGIDPDG